MPKRSSKKPPKARQQSAAADALRKALAKQTKSELVEVIMKFALADRSAMRGLELRFGVEPPAKELLAAARQAIADATDFDEREMNYNFDYDYEAYEAVKRDFGRLIGLGCLHEAMELSLELMSKASYQVEMSDEGLMTDDVEDCLQVVIDAVQRVELPASEVVAWCEAMTRKDRVGFICDEELKALRSQMKARG